MAIREVTFEVALKAVSVVGAKQLRSMAAEAVGWTRGEWRLVGLTGRGARLEARRWGVGLRYRLNGYAHDGADVEVRT